MSSNGSEGEPTREGPGGDDARADGTQWQGGGQVHPGWAQQPQESYEQAQSGGWGAPGGRDTGPLRLSHDASTPSADGTAMAAPGPGSPGSASSGTSGSASYGQEPEQGRETAGATSAEVRQAQQGAYGPEGAPGFAPPYGGPDPQGQGAGYRAPYGPPAGQAAPGYGPGSYGPGPHDPGSYGPGPNGPGPYGPGAPYGWAAPARRPRAGLGAMFDFSFASKATHAIAPLLFWLVVAWGVVNVIYTLVTMTSGGAYGPSGGAVFFAFLASVADALVKIALARLFLELCVNVTDMAERSGGPRP